MKNIFYFLFFVFCFALQIEGRATVPEGTVRYYSMGAFLCPDGEEENWDAGFRVKAVYSNDGKDVWFSNLFPQYFIDQKQEVAKDFFYEAWIHGTINGDHIRISRQVVLSDENFGFMGKKYDANGNEVNCDSVEMVITEDGTLYMADYLVGGVIMDDEYYIPSLASCLVPYDESGNPVEDESGHVKVVDYALGYKLVPLTEEQMTYPEIPSSVQMKNYIYSVTAWDGQTGSKTVSLGFDGNTAYVKGLSTLADASTGEPAYPDVVFKGTLAEDGSSFTLPSTQFCGIDNYYGVAYVTFMMGQEYNYDEEWYEPIAGVKWEKKSDTVWEMAEDTNITYLSLDGNMIDCIALATLTDSSEGIEQVCGNQGTTLDQPLYNVFGQRVNKNARGLLVQKYRKFLQH